MTHVAHPDNLEQEKAIREFFASHNIPHEIHSEDETLYLLASDANKQWLQQSIEEEKKV